MLVVTASASDSVDNDTYSKLVTFQYHLFGYEVPDSILLFTQSPDQLTILTSAKKAKILTPLNHMEGGIEAMGIKLNIIETNKADKNKENIEKLVKLAKNSKLGKRIGEIAEKSSVEYSSAVLAESSKANTLLYLIWNGMKEAGFEFVDISLGLSNLFLIKDSVAKAAMEKAAELTTRALKKYLLPELETIIDEEKQISQAALADLTDDMIKQPAKLGLANNLFRDADVDSCYGPIIQSGGVGEVSSLYLYICQHCANRSLSNSFTSFAYFLLVLRELILI
jgi:nucleosome binding factor SPN SPT16 subunit